MNIFDKICACMAFVLGIVLIILGIMGAFLGCNANFLLPPIYGAIPAIIGWGVVKPIIVAWKKPSFDQPPAPTNAFIQSGPLRPRRSEDNEGQPI